MMILREFPDAGAFRQMAAQCTVVPLCAEILCDTETPITLLQRFYRKEKPIFLFESVNGGEKWGRYSFLGVSSRSRIRIFSDRVQIEENGYTRRIKHKGKPLEHMRAYMKRFTPAPLFEDLRFWCGLVGYINYEAVSFFEKIPNRLDPEHALFDFIVPDALVVFDNHRKTLSVILLYFSENEKSSPDYATLKKRLYDLSASVLSPSLPIGNETPDKPDRLKPILEKSAFLKKVRKVKAHIHAGDVIQAVISQPFACPNPPDPLTLYRALRYVNPSPYLFYLDLGDMTLIGASPETMVRLEDKTAHLCPIAGTRPRGVCAAEDDALAKALLQDEKERAEHIMLVDLGRNDLGRVASTGSVRVTRLLHVERYSHVMHLVSDVSCKMAPGTDAWDLLRAVFPAGTLTGAPKVRAMEIIDELEGAPRGPYGGAVGYVSFSGNMDFAITIRTARIENGRLMLRAGAGIVADSDPEREYMETVHKAEAVNQALQLIYRQKNASKEDRSRDRRHR